MKIYKMPEFYMIIAQKYFPIFGVEGRGGGTCPLSLRLLYTYDVL